MAEISKFNVGCTVYDFQDKVSQYGNRNYIYGVPTVHNDLGSNLAIQEYTYNGMKGYRLTKTADGGWGSFLYWPTKYLDIVEGKPYTLSVFAKKLNNDTSNIYLYFFIANYGSDVYILNETGTTIGNGITVCRNVVAKKTLLLSSSNPNAELGWLQGFRDINLDLFIAHPKLELGTKPTD